MKPGWLSVNTRVFQFMTALILRMQELSAQVSMLSNYTCTHTHTQCRERIEEYDVKVLEVCVDNTMIMDGALTI